MDAAAVSMTNGMTIRPMRIREILAVSFAFGLFQGLMPLIGFFVGSVFAEYMSAIDHWIAFVLLAFIGIKMLWGTIKKSDDYIGCYAVVTFRLLIVQAIATSIDALAVGVSFAALNADIWLSVSVIAVTTFICSFLAVLLGKKCGDLFNKKAEILGGCILILIGIKIFIDGLMTG